MKLSTILKCLKSPFFLLSCLGRRGYLNWLSDELYLKILYKGHIGKYLNLENPRGYTEKLQWIKLYDRNPLYTNLCDKYFVKDYVGKLLGKEYVIPTLGVWDDFEEIDFSILPKKFVLKTTHDSKGVIVCKNKNSFNIIKAKEFLSRHLKANPFYSTREWPYKNIKPRIIAEEFLDDKVNYVPKDYKFYLFNGCVKCILVCSDRFIGEKGTRFDYYDREGNHLPFTQGGLNSEITPILPDNLNKMIQIAETLSKDIPHVRIDLYDIAGKIYFGEFTFFDSSGFDPFTPPEWDIIFGDWLLLPRKRVTN